MTKKDYIIIAKAIKNEVDKINTTDTMYVLKGVGQSLCDELRKDNAGFDSDKFLTACHL